MPSILDKCNEGLTLLCGSWNILLKTSHTFCNSTRLKDKCNMKIYKQNQTQDNKIYGSWDVSNKITKHKISLIRNPSKDIWDSFHNFPHISENRYVFVKSVFWTYCNHSLRSVIVLFNIICSMHTLKICHFLEGSVMLLAPPSCHHGNHCPTRW